MTLKVYADRMSQPSRAVILFCKYSTLSFTQPWTTQFHPLQFAISFGFSVVLFIFFGCVLMGLLDAGLMESILRRSKLIFPSASIYLQNLLVTLFCLLTFLFPFLFFTKQICSIYGEIYFHNMYSNWSFLGWNGDILPCEIMIAVVVALGCLLNYVSKGPGIGFYSTMIKRKTPFACSVIEPWK